MSRYEKMFSNLSDKVEGAFVPFTVLGDPTIDRSLQIVRALVEGGADALELGIPFSDPIADGPTIQTASVRALANGATPENCFEIVRKIRDEYPDLPIGLLVYANLVVSGGITSFYTKAADVGVDSVLVADVPCFEAQDFTNSAEAAGIEPVFIAPPNADEECLKTIARYSKGYTYVVARAGVTGADKDVRIGHAGIFETLRRLNAPPTMLGFGIAKPTHVKTGLQSGADGVISGSAVVGIITDNLDNQDLLVQKVRDFVRQMKEATQSAGASSSI